MQIHTIEPFQAVRDLAINGLESDHWLVLRATGVEPLDLAGSCKISIRIGSLQLLVACCSDPGWLLVGWRTVHQPLWPSRLLLSYYALLRKDLVKPRKESGTVLFHVSLAITRGLTQEEIDQSQRPPLEAMLERFFEQFRPNR
jgi:hypothetical protein